MLKDLPRTCHLNRKESPSHQPCRKVSGDDSVCHSSVQVEHRQVLKTNESTCKGHCLPKLSFKKKKALTGANIVVLLFHFRERGRSESILRGLERLAPQCLAGN
jgi:hypothetical protein